MRKIGGQTETIFVYNGGGKLVAEYSTQISSTPQVSYLTADHLGSPRIITDGGGAVIARHDYMAFGNDVTESIGAVGGRATAQGYNAPEEVRQGYTGYQKDDESGLDFAQARYYNSAHGRFTSVDPLTASATIKNPQTFNRYSYVLNSPYKFSDPLGLMPSGGKPDRGKPVYNQKLADFLDEHMIPASGERATYQPGQSPAVTQTSGGHGSEAQGSAGPAGGSQQTAERVTPPPPPPGVEIIVNKNWVTTLETESGIESAMVDPSVNDRLNKDASTIASNIHNAMIAIFNLNTIAKVTVTLRGGAEIGSKYKNLMMTGGSVGGEIQFETNNPQEIISKLRDANDTIQSQLVYDLRTAESTVAWKLGEKVKLGSENVKSGITVGASFGNDVRRIANEEARSLYLETYNKRFGVPAQFVGDN